MELLIKIDDKDVYETLVKFLKSLHIQVLEKDEKQSDSKQWNALAQEQFLKGYHPSDSIYDNE